MTTEIIVSENPGICPNESQNVTCLTPAEQYRLFDLTDRLLWLTQEEKEEFKALNLKKNDFEKVLIQEAQALAEDFFNAQDNFTRARLKVHIANTNRSENQNSSEIIDDYMQAKKAYLSSYETCTQNPHCSRKANNHLNARRSLGLIS